MSAVGSWGTFPMCRQFGRFLELQRAMSDEAKRIILSFGF